jgi:hypothetical protein
MKLFICSSLVNMSFMKEKLPKMSINYTEIIELLIYYDVDVCVFSY